MRLIVRGVGATVTLTTLHPWSTVKDTKDILQDLLKIPAPRQRLVFRGEELKNNNRRLLEWDITEGSILLLISLGPQELEDPIRPLYSIEPPGFSALVEQAKQGIAKGLIGKLTIDGTGGTYFLRNAQKQEVLVFKPSDEEAFGPNNPRGHIGRMGQQSFRPGVLSGEGHLREIAAYLLDHDQFAGVPQTARMEVACRVLGNSALASPFQNTKKANIRTKVGSMQAFVSSDDVAANFSESMFPVHEVHKIAILDIRLVNTDRNDANILVVNRSKPGTSRGSTNPNKHVFLVPIDHAFCLPDTLEIAWADWAWLGWPQAKRPVDDATKEYVKHIDIEQDIELLRSQLFIREPCLRLMRITHMLLQRAIARGCSLFQIGSIICRKDIDEPSQLEVMCHQATAFSQAIARQGPTRSLYRKWRTDEPTVDRNGEQDGKSSAAPFTSCLDNNNSDNTSNNTSTHSSSASSSTSDFLSLPPLLTSRASNSGSSSSNKKEEKETLSSANCPSLPPFTPRSSSPSFPPPSPSSWSNTPPNSWLPPLVRSRTPSANIANPLPHAQLTSIEEDEIIDIWNSLPLLPTRRSNSSPSSPPSLPSQGPTALSTRTASTPRSQKSKTKKVPLIPRVPKPTITDASLDTTAFPLPIHPPAPSSSTPAAMSVPSMSSNALPYVSPLSLLSRVSQKQQKKQKQQQDMLSISLDMPPVTSSTLSSSISASPHLEENSHSRSPKASHSYIPPRSISSEPLPSSPSGFMSFPVCNPPMLPTSPPPSFASYPLPTLPSSPSACISSCPMSPSSFISFPNVDVNCLPACSSSPLSSTITVASLSMALPSEVNNPSRHEMTCSPEVLAPCTFSPRKQSASANNENGSSSASSLHPSPAKRPEIASLSVDVGNTFATDINNNNMAKHSLYVNTSPAAAKVNGRLYNPRSGNLKMLSGSSPKLKKSLMKRREEAVEEDLNSNDVKIKIIGEDNAQRATKLSTTISGTLRRFGSKMENTERIIRETTAVVAKQIADVSSDTALFISGSANSDLSPQKPWTMKMNDFDENSIPKNNTDSKSSTKPKRFCGHATGSPDGLLCVSDGISVLGNCGNCERDSCGIEKIDIASKHDSAFLLGGPLPLFSAKKGSGERQSSSTGRSSREISEDSIRHRIAGEKSSTGKDRKHPEFGHDKENSHAVNFDSVLSTGVHDDLEAALRSEVARAPVTKRTETDPICFAPMTVAPPPLPASESVGVTSKQAAKFAIGGLPLGLDRPLELKRAMSYSFSVNVHPTGFAPGSKSPTKMVTKSLDNDDWSVPPPSSCDVNPLSPNAASDELFFSCLAKLIDTVLDFTSTKHSPG